MIKENKLGLILLYVLILVLFISSVYAYSWGVCGNNITQGGEECDDGTLNIDSFDDCFTDFYGEIKTCCSSVNCTKVESRGPYCGDETITSPEEDCDWSILDSNARLNGQSCESLGYAIGDLSCFSDIDERIDVNNTACTYDKSDCISFTMLEEVCMFQDTGLDIGSFLYRQDLLSRESFMRYTTERQEAAEPWNNYWPPREPEGYQTEFRHLPGELKDAFEDYQKWAIPFDVEKVKERLNEENLEQEDLDEFGDEIIDKICVEFSRGLIRDWNLDSSLTAVEAELGLYGELNIFSTEQNTPSACISLRAFTELEIPIFSEFDIGMQDQKVVLTLECEW